MTLTASNRFMNWTGVTFAPDGGTLVPITEVQDIDSNPDVQIVGASGDADVYESAKALARIDPKFVIRTQNLQAVAVLPPGTRGTLTFTHNDFMNGALAGAMTRVVDNCIIGNNPIRGAHRQVGEGTINVETYAPDGVTSPISITFAV